ncbi:MAG: aminodeoxychorismate/anthranilate synthase component II [Oscillospiraceae bacterium]|nr:aminodeoxychorismate/anthranilate synthase component II [Oscillospiraceae bacterium]
MVLLIDNYDSFSYNLYQAIGVITGDIKVIRNDELSPVEIEGLSPKCIVISPGPGKPGNAGICIEVIKLLHKKFPILGVCLGHQAIFEAFGGTVDYTARLMHGKQSRVTVDSENPLFRGLPAELNVARYHSLAGVKSTLPDELKVIAEVSSNGEFDSGEIMGVCHREYPVYGLQFHPESILTPMGQRIIENFIGLS